jgi:hypothetical protein
MHGFWVLGSCLWFSGTGTLIPIQVLLSTPSLAGVT